MPLDDREQRILEEIERQFYQEDPKLAQTVARISLSNVVKRRQRIAAVGFVIGLVVMLASFTQSRWIALGGFIVMLASAGWIAMGLRATRGESGVAAEALGSWLGRLRQRWRRGR